MKAVSAGLNPGFGKGFAKPVGSGGRPVVDETDDGVGIGIDIPPWTLDVGAMLMMAEVASNMLE
jgi:hypothetical protein